jgi:hypothetical protein
LKKKSWYKRKEVWGTALTAVSGLLTLFAEHTIAYKVGFGLGIIISAVGLKQGYKANNLPSGITKTIDIMKIKTKVNNESN